MKPRIILTVLFLNLFYLVSFTQGKIIVTGKIYDLNQNPVKGASIFVDDFATGITSNKKGEYKVKVSPSSKVIRIISGAQLMEQPIDGKTVIDFEVPVKLAGVKQSEPATADEVNQGYGNIRKNDLSSSVTKIEGDEKNIYKDIYEMLKSKSGLQVNGKSVRVQGGPNSFQAGTDPLFVVDGVVVSSIDDISPVEVKSIEVLRGSSATIYGSRGANGVILITKKK